MELEVFVRVAERANLSQVAREIGLSQPSVSRISEGSSEARIGARLLIRTSRKVGLTGSRAGLPRPDPTAGRSRSRGSGRHRSRQ
ncbi:helix-turn-helix domain-containing protein [Mesorhizobium atlanticum]